MADAIDLVKDGRPNGDGVQKMKAGAKRTSLLYDLLAERLVGEAKDHYVTAAMQWGLDHEAAAADAFEVATGMLLMPAGLIEHPTIENFAATPDRLIDHDGLLEIKCPTSAKFVAWRLAGTVPDEHRPQMLAQLACTRRRYCMFAAFDPRMPPTAQLFVRRFEPTPAEIATVEQQAFDFLIELEQMFEAFTQSPGMEAIGA
jgi:putative phage-type endonuclease